MDQPTGYCSQRLWEVTKNPAERETHVQGTENSYYRAFGTAEAPSKEATEPAQRWMKGVSGGFALKKLGEQPVPW